jgi:hypothetical protein
MPIQLKEENGGKLLEVHVSGKLAKADYEHFVPEFNRLAKFIGQVNAILAQYPAFRRGANCQFVDDGHAAVLAAFRHDNGPKDLGFLVVCNFDTQQSQRITVSLATVLGSDGPFACRELLSDEARIVQHSRLELVLPRCAAQVLRFSKSG